MKRCSMCGQEFPATPDSFCRDKRNKDGLSAHCRSCDRARKRTYMKKRRQKNPDLNALYYAQNREREIERLARYHEEHPEQTKERVARWARENREKRRVNEIRRRAQKRNSEGTHTDADVERQYKAQKGKCFWCGVKLGDDNHIDHVIPLSRNGSNGPENIVVACPSCNLSKSDKLPSEWLKGRFL